MEYTDEDLIRTIDIVIVWRYGYNLAPLLARLKDQEHAELVLGNSESPLQTAVTWNRAELLPMLAEKFCPLKRYGNQKSAYELAKELGEAEVIEALEAICSVKRAREEAAELSSILPKALPSAPKKSRRI